MKKFHSYNKRNEEHQRIRERQGPKTEEPRNFSKHDSWREYKDDTECKDDYFADKNKPLRNHKYSYQMDKKSKVATQSFVKTSKYQTIRKYDLEENNDNMNPTSKYRYLTETNGVIKQSDLNENCQKLHEGIHPLCSNKKNAFPHSNNQNFKSISKPTDMNVNLKNECLAVNVDETECFNARENNERKSSKNCDIKDKYLRNENFISVFQKCDRQSYDSYQYCNKQDNNQSNVYYDLPQNNHYIQEEINSQSDDMDNDSHSYESVGFSTLKLTDLIYYNANLMQDQQLFEYASAVKSKILEKIDKFQYREKEELEVLCEITDGDQSEKNQRIITTRTCCIVKNIIEQFPHFLSILETPVPSHILVCQSLPSFIPNNNYEPPVLKIVQNSEMMLTSITDYNIMHHYNIAQHNKCITSKGISTSLNIINSDDHIQKDSSIVSEDISDSFDSANSVNHRNSSPIQNLDSDNARNNSPINSPVTARENIDTEESPKHCLSPVNSGERTPERKFSFDEDNSTFIVFGLDNLLKYDVSSMQGEMVFDYAFSLKKKILQNIDDFCEPYKEKLKFLCELTDGTQIEQNQKLINERMCELINDYEKQIENEEYQNLNRQSRTVHPRSHDDDKSVHGHRQNFSDRQSRNVHYRKSQYEDVVHEHRRNFTDGQSKNVHQRRSYYKDDYRQNLGVQSKDLPPRRSHYSDARRR